MTDDKLARSNAEFLNAILTATPNGEWIKVQYHPNGDWSVAGAPAPQTVAGGEELQRIWDVIRDFRLENGTFLGDAITSGNDKINLCNRVKAAALSQPAPTAAPAGGTEGGASAEQAASMYRWASAGDRERGKEMFRVGWMRRQAAIGEAAPSGELAQVREALTPYGETKYAYSGEFSWTEWLPDENGNDQGYERVVPWTTIKEIMAAIRHRAGVDVLDESDCEAALRQQVGG